MEALKKSVVPNRLLEPRRPSLKIIKNTFFGDEFCIRIMKYQHVRFGGGLGRKPSKIKKSILFYQHFENYVGEKCIKTNCFFNIFKKHICSNAKKYVTQKTSF